MGSFNDFYADTAQQTLLVIYAMCGDRNVAQESVNEAYEQAANVWDKISAANPEAYVRDAAWHRILLNRTQHPLRRHDESGADTELLDALQKLPADTRRLIVLLTVGGLDIEQAAPELQISIDDGLPLVSSGLAALQESLGTDIAALERRLIDLGSVTGKMTIPGGDQIRESARATKLRNTIIGVAVASLGILGTGIAVAADGPFQIETSLPQRKQIGNEGTDQVLIASRFNEEHLLTPGQLEAMNPKVQWEVTATESDVDGDIPYATCPTERFANENPLHTFVRTFEGTGSTPNRLAQAIEISKTQSEAEEAFQKTVAWFAECQHPRVQLTESYLVERPTGDFLILRLQSHRDKLRTFTVGLSQNGAISMAIVNETEGNKGPNIEAFANMMNESVYRLCVESGGECPRNFKVLETTPPSAAADPAFLGVVDLPPVPSVDSIWAASEAKASKENTAQTLCEAASWNKALKDSKASRVFVMPEAGLPDRFGLTQTVAAFESDKEATRWLTNAEAAMETCPRRVLSIDIEDRMELNKFSNAGKVYSLSVRVEDGTARVRTGFVRRGNVVSQVTLTAVDQYDMSNKSFKALLERAGQRLVYAKESDQAK